MPTFPKKTIILYYKCTMLLGLFVRSHGLLYFVYRNTLITHCSLSSGIVTLLSRLLRFHHCKLIAGGHSGTVQLSVVRTLCNDKEVWGQSTPLPYYACIPVRLLWSESILTGFRGSSGFGCGAGERAVPARPNRASAATAQSRAITRCSPFTGSPRSA